MKIKEKLKLIKEGKLTAEENIKNFLGKIKKDDKQGKKINAFLQLNDHALLEAKEVDSNVQKSLRNVCRTSGCSEMQKVNISDIKKGKAGRLAGLAIAVKANINVKGLFASCASKTLENYKATYNATVVDKIRKEGGIIMGITNMDEFACGSSGETSAFGATKNPKNPSRIPGGSSSGSAAAVSAGFCDLALGTDTGGSVRNPASHCGVVGLKGSYGAVSRYGLIDLSMSLEQIGCFSPDVFGAELLFDVIKGKDEKDATSLVFDNPKKNIKVMKIGFIDIKADGEILALVKDKVTEVCSKNKWNQQNVKIEHIDLGIQAYYPINYVEFFSATRKYDGRKYGRKIEENCGEEVLRRILGGGEIAQAEFSGKYYRKALQAKKLIEKEILLSLNKFDCLILPTVPKLPHKLGTKVSVEDMYDYDSLTTPANLSGVPAISVPCGEIQGVPIGMQIMCGKGEEGKMLEIAKRFEK